MVSAEEPTDSAPRAFEPKILSQKEPTLRFPDYAGAGGGLIFGFVLIRGTALWILKVMKGFPDSRESLAAAA